MVSPDLLDDDRREAFGRLVEQQEPRAGAQDAADRQHLLLAAGQLGALAARAAPSGSGTVRRCARVSSPPGRTCGGSSRFSSTVRLAKMPRSSGQNAMPGARDRSLVQRDQLVALVADRAGALADDAHDRLQRRGLAGAVAAEQRDHLAGSHLEVDAVQDVRLAVPGLQILDRRAATCAAQAWPTPR